MASRGTPGSRHTAQEEAEEHKRRLRAIPWLYHMHRVYESQKRTRARRRLEREDSSEDEEEVAGGSGMRGAASALVRFACSHGRWICSTAAIVFFYSSLVCVCCTRLVPLNAQWNTIVLEPGATALVPRNSSTACAAVLLWDSLARPWGSLPHYYRLLNERTASNFGSWHATSVPSAQLVHEVPGRPQCDATDVNFSEKFVIPDMGHLARHYYLVAGSVWTYTLKAHMMAPADVLHLSWHDFAAWKRSPGSVHGESAGVRTIEGEQTLKREWVIEKEGRYVVVVVPAATNSVDKQRRTSDGALGGIAHHIRRKAHCGKCSKSPNTSSGVLITMPIQTKQIGGEHVFFTPSYFWGAGGLGAGRLDPTTEAWRCKSDVPLYEACAVIIGWPVGLHLLGVFLVAAGLSALSVKVLAAGITDIKTPLSKRRSSSPPAQHKRLNKKAVGPAFLTHSPTAAEDKGTVHSGDKATAGGKVKSQSQEGRIQSQQSQRGRAQSRQNLHGLLPLLLSTHERQFAEFEKAARRKDLVTLENVPWPTLEFYKEQLRQVNASGVQGAASKTAKEWSRRWHPDKWTGYNLLPEEEEAILYRVTEVRLVSLFVDSPRVSFLPSLVLNQFLPFTRSIDARRWQRTSIQSQSASAPTTPNCSGTRQTTLRRCL